MKLEYFLWCGLAIVLALTSPVPARAEAASAAKVDRRTSPALWKIEAGPGSAAGPGVLYMLGSVHVGPAGGWQLSPKVLEILDASDGLVVEIDEMAQPDEDRDDVILLYGMIPVGGSLHELISPELYRELRAYLAKVDRPINGLDQLRPWMVAVALTVNELQHLGYAIDGGLDLDLMKRTRGKMPIVPLETAREQLEMLDQMSPKLQEMMLRDALQQTDQIKVYFESLISAWRSGDEARLDRLLFRELNRTPELAPFYEKVIFKRNESMRIRLESLLATGKSHFVVVGAAHLVGGRGIVQSFMARGYSASRIESSW